MINKLLFVVDNVEELREAKLKLINVFIANMP